MPESKSGALPLGDAPIKQGGLFNKEQIHRQEKNRKARRKNRSRLWLMSNATDDQRTDLIASQSLSILLGVIPATLIRPEPTI